jgi:ribonuclease BN (tRNA processing enzyme)
VAVDLTVLGSSGSHTGPGRACSGYLLRSGDVELLLDCGNGSTANLQRHSSFEQLDAIVITHRHVDHCIDLIGMFYALRFHPDGRKNLDLYAAPEVLDVLTGLLSEDSRMSFREVFRCHEIAGGDHLDIGPFALDMYPSIHPVPTVSVRIGVEGRIVTFSSDSAGGPDLVEAARGADLFLCEATWWGDPEDWPAGLHLTAREAGRIATEAGVDRLLLTHILGSADRERSLEEARETFTGSLALADDNQIWTLT